MATRYWTGRAASVAQVTKVVFSSIVATNTYSVTINGKTVSVVAASTSLTDLVAALINAWGASAEPEHQEAVASEMLNPTLEGLRLDAVTPSNPMTITASATTGTATVTTVTAASGPTFWKLAGNWDGGTLPASTDTLILEDFSGDILDGLTDTNNYATIEIRASFTGTIGRPSTNPQGYPEYRTQRLTLSNGSATTALLVGYGNGNGSRSMRFDFLTSTVNGTVQKTGQTSDDGYAIDASGVDSGTWHVYGGRVRFVSSNIVLLNVIKSRTAQLDPYVYCDSTNILTDANVYGGEATLECQCDFLKAREQASVWIEKAGLYDSVTVSDNAVIYDNSTGAIGNMLTVENQGLIDFGSVATAKTIAACKIHAGGSIQDPWDRVTWTTGIQLQACRLADVSIDIGVGITI